MHGSEVLFLMKRQWTVYWLGRLNLSILQVDMSKRARYTIVIRSFTPVASCTERRCQSWPRPKRPGRFEGGRSLSGTDGWTDFSKTTLCVCRTTVESALARERSHQDSCGHDEHARARVTWLHGMWGIRCVRQSLQGFSEWGNAPPCTSRIDRNFL